MNFVGYEEIPWQSVKDTDKYKFSPEFLQPIWSMLKDGEYSVHQTNRGDLIILNSAGLVAAKRKFAGNFMTFSRSRTQSSMPLTRQLSVAAEIITVSDATFLM